MDEGTSLCKYGGDRVRMWYNRGHLNTNTPQMRSTSRRVLTVVRSELTMATSNYTSDIPYGYCHCGCGQKTTIAKLTNSKRGRIKGDPTRYINGHHQRIHASNPIPRFWSKVNKDGPIPQHCPEIGKCWEWTASALPQGYGVFCKEHSAHTVAHRYSWELANGEIADGLFVLHKCDNPACVNPSHLFLGTSLDNSNDKVSKGRQSRLHGEKNGRAKLTVDQVDEIRNKHANKQGSLRTLAIEYGMSKTTISEIVNEKTWRKP